MIDGVPLYRNDLVPTGTAWRSAGGVFMNGLTLALTRTALNAPVVRPVLKISFGEWRRWKLGLDYE